MISTNKLWKFCYSIVDPGITSSCSDIEFNKEKFVEAVDLQEAASIMEDWHHDRHKTDSYELHILCVEFKGELLTRGELK